MGDEVGRTHGGRAIHLFERGLFGLGVAALGASMIAGLVQGFEMSAAPPFGAMSYPRVAREHLAAGRFEEAAAEYRGDQRISQVQISASLNLARILREMGDPDAAVEALRVGARQSLDPKLHVHYARALAAEGRVEDAERALLRAVGLDPRDADTRVALGNFYARQGRFADAATAFEAALAIDASLTEVRFQLADAQERLAAMPSQAGAGEAP